MPPSAQCEKAGDSYSEKNMACGFWDVFIRTYYLTRIVYTKRVGLHGSRKIKRSESVAVLYKAMERVTRWTSAPEGSHNLAGIVDAGGRVIKYILSGRKIERREAPAVLYKTMVII